MFPDIGHCTHFVVSWHYLGAAALTKQYIRRINACDTSNHQSTFYYQLSYGTSTAAMFSVYTISSNYNGQQHSVKFFPGGYGHSYDGYITTLEQFQDNLNETYDTSAFKVMYISSSCEMKEIEDDDDLFLAVEELDDGACLPVKLFDGYQNRKKSTRKNKKYATKKGTWNGYWYDSASSSSSEEEEASSSSSHVYQAQMRRGTSKHSNLGAILDRFINYEGSDEYYHQHECHHCDRTEWSGARYEYYMHSGYSMCDDCHANLSRTDKKSWPLASGDGSYTTRGNWVLPWEVDVPSYPLYREEGCPVRDETRHLQYLLTRIGTMPLKDTDVLTGSYQGRTERAVEKFRREHGIYGDDMTVYNKRMARKLKQIVKQLRSEGHEYL